LGNRIATLDDIAGQLHELNVQLLGIIEELVKSLSNVFRKTEECYDNYKGYIDSLNRFFHDRLISGRFYFTIDFEVSPSLDISWIEHMRRSFDKSAAEQVHEDMDPGRFIEEFYRTYAKAKKATPLQDLLNPKKYFILRVKLTDENNKTIPGSTGESYTAIALLGIARLSIVQDGNRPGLRFIILEESATLDNINFNMFPLIAKQYGYQIVTMTPKPYAIGEDEGWYIHNLLGGKENKDINYPEVFSVFRTPKENIRLDTYLSGKRNELADL
jgi:DNA repair protein SbcC/Rad50